MSGSSLTLGEKPITVADVVLASRGGLSVTLATDARARMERTRAILDDHLVRGVPVYGLTTGLGANTGHRIAAGEAADLQAQLALARVAGVGPALPVETCRAVLFARLAGLARGGAGISLPVFDHLAAMLARDVIPAIPTYGSIGASDLVQTMSIAAAAIGEGRVWHRGELAEAATALAASGLAPVRLAPKDALSIGSTSSLSAATAALAIAALDDLLRLHVATAALSCQGFGAHSDLFDARTIGARPASEQVRAAALFRQSLEGSDLAGTRPVKVQDAISFRGLPQVTGSALAALSTARRETEIELNAAADNPLAIAEDGVVLSNANFLTASLSLAFDTLGIALAHLATASVQRSIKLMTGRLSGLPNYLSPVGGASAGFVPMQKTLAALHAEVRLKATPASLDGIVVSDMVEDLAFNTLLCVTKVEEQRRCLSRVIAIEAMLAAQAVDLRRASEPTLALGAGSAIAYDAVRSSVPMLREDRPTGPDADRVHDALAAPACREALLRVLGEVD